MNGGSAPVYESVGICRRFLHEVRAPMGDGKVLEKMGERRKYVRRDATVGRLSAIFLEDMEGSVKPTLACYRRNINATSFQRWERAWRRR